MSDTDRRNCGKVEKEDKMNVADAKLKMFVNKFGFV